MRRDLFSIRELSIVTGRSCEDLWLGRPDILILKRRPDGGLANVFIGEVKYTINSEYAYQGLRELMEYMALAEYNDEFVTPYGTTFESNIIKGALFVDRCDKKSIKCVLPRTSRYSDSVMRSSFKIMTFRSPLNLPLNERKLLWMTPNSLDN